MESYYQAFRDLMQRGIETEKLVACVYGLYQDYLIDDDTEESLYNLVDPDEQYNSPAEYWYGLDESDRAWKYIKSL